MDDTNFVGIFTYFKLYNADYMKSKYLSKHILLVFSSMLFSQENSSYSLLKIGASKNLNGVEYKLIEAKKVESNIHLKIEVKNIDRKNFNYSALLFHISYIILKVNRLQILIHF